MRKTILLAGALLASEGADDLSPSMLSDEQMTQTLGGVNVTSWDFPTGNNMYQPQDNQQFRMTASNPFSSAVAVGVFSGSSKYGAGTMTAVNGGSQSVRIRTQWPIDTVKRNIVLKYYDTASSTWATATGATRTDMHLPSGLKVARVRFYHTQESGGTNATSVAGSLTSLVDNADYDYNWQDTASADAITQQCAGDKRWQFRYEAVSTETIAAGCNTIRVGRGCGGTGQPACASGTGDNCPNYVSVMDTMIANRATADGKPAADYAHVIFVNSWQEWDPATSTYKGSVRGLAVGGKRWVLVRDNLDDWGMSKTVTHELMHQQGLCHINDTGCAQYNASNDCADPERDHNLMCTSSGRELLGSQCDIASASTRFRDWL